MDFCYPRVLCFHEHIALQDDRVDISITLSRLTSSSVLASNTTMIYGHKHLSKDVASFKETLLGAKDKHTN